VFTSPPYAEQRKEQYGGVPTDEYVEWWDAVQSNVRANLASDGSFFVNIKPHCEDGQRVLYVFDLVLAMVRRWGWRFVDELCWVHQGFPGMYGDKLKNQFEPIYHLSIGDCKHIFKNALVISKNGVDGFLNYSDGATIQSGTGSVFSRAGKGFTRKEKDNLVYPGNVISISAGEAFLHAAAFPVALHAFFVKAYSDEGDVWLDPFLGSGTTIVAAHNNGRRGLGIEKLEKYVAVCLERLQGIGLEPRLVESGA